MFLRQWPNLISMRRCPDIPSASALRSQPTRCFASCTGRLSAAAAAAAADSVPETNATIVWELPRLFDLDSRFMVRKYLSMRPKNQVEALRKDSLELDPALSHFSLISSNSLMLNDKDNLIVENPPSYRIRRPEFDPPIAKRIKHIPTCLAASNTLPPEGMATPKLAEKSLRSVRSATARAVRIMATSKFPEKSPISVRSAKARVVRMIRTREEPVFRLRKVKIGLIFRKQESRLFRSVVDDVERGLSERHIIDRRNFESEVRFHGDGRPRDDALRRDTERKISSVIEKYPLSSEKETKRGLVYREQFKQRALAKEVEDTLDDLLKTYGASQPRSFRYQPGNNEDEGATWKGMPVYDRFADE